MGDGPRRTPAAAGRVCQRRRVHTRRLLLLPLLALALAGCAGGPAPVDWARLDACALVPDAERAGLGLGTATRAGGPVPACRWSGAGRSAGAVPSVGTSLLVAAGTDGYASTVAGLEAGQAREDAQVGGRPAAVFGSGQQVCAVVVDADGGAFTVIGDQGCDGARRVAETALRTAPSASS